MKKTGWIAATAFLIITLVGVGFAEDKPDKDNADASGRQIMGGTFQVLEGGKVVAMVFSDTDKRFERWVFKQGWNIGDGTTITFKTHTKADQDVFDELRGELQIKLNAQGAGAQVAPLGNKHLWTRYKNDTGVGED